MFNIDKEQTLLQTPLIDTDQVRQSINITEARQNLKLIEGKNGHITLLPLGSKLGIGN